MDNTFLGKFAKNVALAIHPLVEGLQDEGAFKKLMGELGWSVGNIPSSALTSVNTHVNTLFTNLNSLSSSPTEQDILGIINDIYNVHDSVQTNISSITSALTGLGSLSSTFATEVPSTLFQLLIAKYLNNNFPSIHNTFRFLSVIQYQYVGASGVRPSYNKVTFDYGLLTQVATNPSTLIKTTYNWNAIGFSFAQLISTFIEVISSAGLTARYYVPSVEAVSQYNSVFSNTDIVSKGIDINLASIYSGSEYIPFTFKLLESLGSGTNLGVIGQLDFPSGLTVSQEITPSSRLEFNYSSAVNDSLVLLIKPSGIDFRHFSGASPNLENNGVKIRLINSFEMPLVIFGRNNGSKLIIKNVTINFSLIEHNNGNEFVLSADLSGLTLVTDPTDTDGFIGKLLGGKAREINMPLVIRWSSITGITFSNSPSFEVNVNTNINLGPVSVKGGQISVKAPAGLDVVNARIGANIVADLGPVNLTIENIGMALDLDTAGGNVGPFGISLGFKPPTGVGISVNSDQVKGGGFLSIDTAKGIYKGAVHLEVMQKFSLLGIGVITTKNPDGSPGYSMLALASATFKPGIALGYGFTLDGAGVLLGINRDMNPDAIREGVSSGTINQVLFPANVEENIHSIISNLESFFPAAQGRYVLGILCRINWGLPQKQQMTVNMAVVVNLPKPVRAAIMGYLTIGLPEANPDKRILTITATFAGIIDFDQKYMMFDARIQEANLLTFKLTGDICMRLFWGERKEFLISAGGFHPSYQVPAFMKVPAMQRITMSMQSEIFSLAVKSYVAVTTNTVQFGVNAMVEFKFEDIIKVRGEVGFDALFQFNPFYVKADAHGMISLSALGKEIMGISLLLNITGPGPWNAKGSVNYSIVGIKGTEYISKTWGASAPDTIAPTINVAPLMQVALNDISNWKSEMPDRFQLKVALRKLADGNNIIFPNGTLTIAQTIVPLGIKIQNYGQQTIGDGGFYDIDTLKFVDDSNVVYASPPVSDVKPVKGDFAPAQFLKMSDEDKLRAKSFESLKCGNRYSITGDAVWSPTIPAILKRTLKYEKIIVDKKHRVRPIVSSALNSFLSANFVKSSTATTNPVISRHAKFNKKPMANAMPVQEQYRVKTAGGLAYVPSTGLFFSKAEVKSYMNTQDPLVAAGIIITPTYYG